MHLVGLLVTVLSGAAFWYWRYKMVRDAGGEVIDTIERMRGAYKRRQFRQKAASAPLASIIDPAIAAVVFYLCLAAEKPQSKTKALDAIREHMNGIIAPRDLEEVLTFGEWAARNVVNPHDPIRRFRALWTEKLSSSEREELIAIAEIVAAADGEPTPEQGETLDALRRALSV